jgi:hypothetical protein
MGQTEPELSKEFGRRQVAFEAMPFRPLRVEDEDRRRPLRVEALEDLRLLLDVSAVWNEVVGDKRRDLGIRVDLGIQPSASPSHRRGAEVEKYRLAGFVRVPERCVDISLPVDFHGLTSTRDRSNRRATHRTTGRLARRPSARRLSLSGRGRLTCARGFFYDSAFWS